MATQYGPHASDLSFKAAEDLSDYQYHFVKVNTSGEVRLIDSALETPDGVLQNDPESGEEATVRIFGPTKVVANAALDEGDFVRAEYVSGTDCGKAAGTTANSGVVLGKVIEATGAEDDLANIILFPAIGTTRNTVVTTDATAGARTYTAAEFLGGLILRDCAGGNRSDVTPTAALLNAAMAALGLGSIEFTIRNFSDQSETITVTAGEGVTLVGSGANTTTITIGQNNSKRFLYVATAAATGNLYSLGTAVH